MPEHPELRSFLGRFTVATFLFRHPFLEFAVETKRAAVDATLNIVPALITLAVTTFVAVVIALVECNHHGVAHIGHSLLGGRSDC